MPVASNCSATIFLACQPGAGLNNEEAAFKKITWSVMEANSLGVDHYGFSMNEVDDLEDGEYYE